MTNFIIVSNKEFKIDDSNKQIEEINWFYFSQKSELNYEIVNKINPKFIFFPFWSSYIPEAIYKNFECIVFHMTDLPYGRGGSPLQNLIVRGKTQTKLSALRVSEHVDAGDVYFKESLSLYGTAEEIYIRASELIKTMIIKITNSQITPSPQIGEPYFFTRRTPEQSSISECSTIEQVFDYIRMLDAQGYPNAFIETELFRFEFTRASLKSDKSILADVRIFKK